MHDSFQDSAHWSTGTTARSPLLMLGGSVVAAVMLIGTGLSVLGTETSPALGASSNARFAQQVAERFAAQHTAQSTAVVTMATTEMKSLQLASNEGR